MVRIDPVSVALGALAGAALGAFALRLADPPAPPPPPVDVGTPAIPAAADPGSGSRASGDVDPILRRLQEVLDRLGALEQRLDLAPRGAPVAAGTDARTAATMEVDVDSLQRAMAAIDQRRLDEMSIRGLRQLAQRSLAEGRHDEAVRACELVLARAATPAERAAALGELGIAQRARGDEAGLTAAAQSFLTLIAEQGAHSRAGLDAAYQLVWTRSAQRAPAAALAHADEIVRSPQATAEQRRQARWAGAIMRQQLGEAAAARAEFERLLRELDPDRDRELADDIRQRLRRLDGR